jgi:hypothetical protein
MAAAHILLYESYAASITGFERNTSSTGIISGGNPWDSTIDL